MSFSSISGRARSGGGGGQRRARPPRRQRAEGAGRRWRRSTNHLHKTTRSRSPASPPWTRSVRSLVRRHAGAPDELQQGEMVSRVPTWSSRTDEDARLRLPRWTGWAVTLCSTHTFPSARPTCSKPSRRAPLPPSSSQFRSVCVPTGLQRATCKWQHSSPQRPLLCVAFARKRPHGGVQPRDAREGHRLHGRGLCQAADATTLDAAWHLNPTVTESADRVEDVGLTKWGGFLSNELALRTATPPRNPRRKPTPRSFSSIAA